MKKASKSILLIIAIIMVVTFSFTGCNENNNVNEDNSNNSEVTNDNNSNNIDNNINNNNNNDNNNNIENNNKKAENVDLSEYRELILYCIGTTYPLNDQVIENFNEKAKEKVNTGLKLKLLGWGDYQEKYPLLFASGEPVDLVYTSTWLNYPQLAQRGAFTKLDELLPEYAPDIWERLSDVKKLQAKVNGHMYAIPTLKDTYSALGPIVRGDLMEKYNMSSINNLDDYAEFMKKVAEDEEEDMVGVFTASGDTDLESLYLFSKNVYPLTGAGNSLFWVDLEAGNNKVIQPWIHYEGLETEYLPWANAAADDGCWSPDILANKDDQLFNQGRAASEISNIDRWATWYINNPEWDPQFYEFNAQIEVLSGMQDALGIPSQSKYPERALMLYNEMCTDKELFDAFEYGIEGVTCEFPDDRHVVGIDQEMYDMDPYLWSMRTNELTRLQVGIPPTWIDTFEHYGEVAVPNILRAFNLDTSEIESEYANCLNVLKQYAPPLEVGVTDPVDGLAELQEQLEIAGVQKCIDEIQRQVDSFLEKHQ